MFKYNLFYINSDKKFYMLIVLLESLKKIITYQLPVYILQVKKGV